LLRIRKTIALEHISVGRREGTYIWPNIEGVASVKHCTSRKPEIQDAGFT
jgi:hypothetical protein